MLQNELSRQLSNSLSALDGFTPFTLDTSPLQKLLSTLVQQVESCRQENAAIREELAEMRVARRLEALEQGIQSLAETAMPAFDMVQLEGIGSAAEGDASHPSSPFFGSRQATAATAPRLMSGGLGAVVPPAVGGTPAAAAGATTTAAQGGVVGAVGSISGGPMFPPRSPGILGGASGFFGIPRTPMLGGVDFMSLIVDVNGMKERLTQLERKSEALWHKQETDEQLRGSMDRLRHDIEALQASAQEHGTSGRTVAAATERLEAGHTQALDLMHSLQEKMQNYEASIAKSADERRDMALKLETTMSQVWDQIRHVEASLSQRLTMAETAQVSTQQDAEETRELANDMLARVDEVKRHIGALEGKLESFNSAVAAAISPLHQSLERQSERIDDVDRRKQDVASAVTSDDVAVAMARAVDHTDRRVDNMLKSVAGLENRLEDLTDDKASKSDVVMTVDLEAILGRHAAELDHHLDCLKASIMEALSIKADREDLGSVDARLSSRLSGLESAILKGLKAISDKVSAALGEKLDLAKFNEFRIQVRAILADVEDRLRDWTPTAVGLKASLAPDGNAGATSCLSCDARVRSVRELKNMGFTSEDRVMQPEKLPLTDPLLLPIIHTRPAPLGAFSNAKLTGRQQEGRAMMNRQAHSVMETMPTAGSGAQSPAHQPTASAVDAVALASLSPPTSPVRTWSASKSSGRRAPMDVKVETISGAISQGRIPNTRGKGGPIGPTVQPPTNRAQPNPNSPTYTDLVVGAAPAPWEVGVQSSRAESVDNGPPADMASAAAAAAT